MEKSKYFTFAATISMTLIISGIFIFLYTDNYFTTKKILIEINNNNNRFLQDEVKLEDYEIHYDNLCTNNRHKDGVWKLKNHHSEKKEEKSFYCCGWDNNGIYFCNNIFLLLLLLFIN